MINGRMHFMWLCLVVGAVIGSGMFGCGSSESPSQKQVTKDRQATKGRIVPWRLVEVELPNTLRLVAHVEYCVGEVEPTIGRVNVRHRDGVVLVTVEAEVGRRRPLKRNEVCLGAERPLYRQVTLSRPLGGRTIVDGSFDPPKRKWPQEP